MSPKLLRRAVRELNLFLSGGTTTLPNQVYGRDQRGSTDRVGNRAALDDEPDAAHETHERQVKVVRYDRKNRRITEKRG